MIDGTKTKLTRKELYGLVWSEPLTVLGKKFNISDVGLRKICIKMNIPLPKAGYWTKVKFGKNPRQIKLPVDAEVKDEVVITATSPDVQEVYTQISERRELEKKIEQEIPELLRVPEKVTKWDRLIKDFKDYHNQKDGHTISYRDVLGINVTTKNVARALRFMDTLIKVLRHRGHNIVIENGSTFVQVHGEQIKIYLKEKEKRVINANAKYSWDQYELVSTGTFYLKLGQWSHVKEFNENKIPIEEQIAKIVAAIECEAHKEALERIEREKRWAEQERLQKIKDEIARKKEMEIEEFKSLLKNAKQFHEASLMRIYITEVEQKAIDQNRLNEELTAWIEWACRKADEHDPTVIRKFI